MEPIDKETIELIWADLGTNRENLQRDVGVLKECFKKLPHLPEIPSDTLIEKFILMNKCRLEIAKRRLENYYVVRSKSPDIFSVINPSNNKMQEFMDLVYFVPLPKLDKDLRRVTFLSFVDGDPEKFDPILLFGLMLNVGEVRIHEDVCMNQLYIIDFKWCKLSYLSKITPMMLRKAIIIVEKVYTSRTKGLHFVNCPPYMAKFLKLLKTLLPTKTSERMFVHESLESLQETFSKEILPKDYGGYEMSLEELQELMRHKFAKYKDHFDHLDTLKVDESLRIGEANDDFEFLGLAGSFKKLQVD